tara:strand:- start:234 stop:455 length:222 start_codon:yes stop_codon:yes gene_type:complete
MEIIKNIPIPPKYEKYSSFLPLLKMEIGDCVEFTDRKKLCAANSYLNANSFKMRQKKMSKRNEPFLARLWRVE